MSEKTNDPRCVHEGWYRGWELYQNDYAAEWGAELWHAYKGGADIDALHVNGRTFEELLSAIDDEEREE